MEGCDEQRMGAKAKKNQGAGGGGGAGESRGGRDENVIEGRMKASECGPAAAAAAADRGLAQSPPKCTSLTGSSPYPCFTVQCIVGRSY